MDSDATTFSDLKLNSWIIKRLATLGIKKPTPIQKNCIIPILEGNDCIGAAKTGSGKTLAFALPILQKLSEDPYGVFAVVLTPTRELAYQIYNSFSIIGKAVNIRVSVVIGGLDMTKQHHELTRQPHVVVATPGRLSDILENYDSSCWKRLKFLVLDEADRLLSGGFDEQITSICNILPKCRQTLCFSATITDTIKCLREITKGNVFQWEQSSEVATVEELKQYYLLCPHYVKDGYLVQAIKDFLEENAYASVIIFTDTCINCELLSMTMNEVGIENVPLHGMTTQWNRLQSLSKFKSNQVRILIATDLASRGLDIPEVELVINHNVPNSPKDYIHRVGRTARAGKGGIAITIVTPSDIKLVHAIEKETGVKLQEFKVDNKEVAKIFTTISVAKRGAEVKLDFEDFNERKAINKRKQLILEGKDPNDPRYGVSFENNDVLIKRKKNSKSKNKKSSKI